MFALLQFYLVFRFIRTHKYHTYTIFMLRSSVWAIVTSSGIHCRLQPTENPHITLCLKHVSSCIETSTKCPLWTSLSSWLL